MTAPYTPPYRITPDILHSIEQIGEPLVNPRAHLDQFLMSDQESDHQCDQVKCLVLRGI